MIIQFIYGIIIKTSKKGAESHEISVDCAGSGSFDLFRVLVRERAETAGYSESQRIGAEVPSETAEVSSVQVSAGGGIPPACSGSSNPGAPAR